MAQVQNPRCSSKLRSRRRPLSGSSAQTRPVVWVFITDRRSVTPAAVNSRSGPGRVRRRRAVRGGAAAFGRHPGDQGRQHRQPFPGPLVHPGFAL